MGSQLLDKAANVFDPKGKTAEMVYLKSVNAKIGQHARELDVLNSSLRHRKLHLMLQH
jgi:hypothetical protein